MKKKNDESQLALAGTEEAEILAIAPDAHAAGAGEHVLLAATQSMGMTDDGVVREPFGDEGADVVVFQCRR